ncbi:TPA: hypothetical protein ACPSKB_000642 [Legionella feeleii]
MIGPTAILDQLSNDKKPTFREILTSLINKANREEISTILLGEIHDNSPTWQAILANLDVLSRSKKRVVLIFEHLNQDSNPDFKRALGKAQKGSNNPLKHVQAMQEKTIDSFIFFLAVTNAGIPVLGAENKASNPFYKLKGQIPMETLREMEKFQRSPDRIIKTNETFANFIKEYCGDDILPIFVGGAAHPILLKQGDLIYDPGIQGRIPKSVAIYLVDSATPTSQENAPYYATDRNSSGNYDYQVETNKLALYKDSFDGIPQLIDKIKFLLTALDQIMRGHALFFKDSTFLLKEDTNVILLAFQASVQKEIKFLEFDVLVEHLVTFKKSQNDNDSKPSFFKSKDSIYTWELLKTAIYHDLATLLHDEIKHQSITKYVNSPTKSQ